MELRRLVNTGLARAVILAAAVVAVATLVRLWIAAGVPLAPDEAYYWIWSQALSPGYFDHPPMVALWIRAGTALAGQTPLGVRLLGPLATAVGSGFLFDAGRILFPGTLFPGARFPGSRRPARWLAGAGVGTISVVLLNATLLVGVGSIIMTPDSPLLLFWTLTLWAMARLIVSGNGTWWLAAGVFAGLAGLSKYTAIFLWVGIGLWAVVVPQGRIWLRRWQPWTAVAIGAALFLPVVVWNASHEWAGLLKQGGRVADWQPARAAGFLAELVGGQVGLATPWIFVLCMIGLGVAARRSWAMRDPRWTLLAALSVPPVAVFLQHAIGDRVQGNWPAIIYPALALAAAVWLAERGRRDWIGASALGFGITVVVYLQVVFGLIPLPPGLDPIALRPARLGCAGAANRGSLPRHQCTLRCRRRLRVGQPTGVDAARIRAGGRCRCALGILRASVRANRGSSRCAVARLSQNRPTRSRDLAAGRAAGFCDPPGRPPRNCGLSGRRG